MLPVSISIATLCGLLNFVIGVQSVTIEPTYATYYVVEPRPLNMTCTSEEGTSLEWYKGTRKVTELGFTSSRKMDILSASKNKITATISLAVTSAADSGEYRCQVDGNGVSRTIQVQVLKVVTTNAEYNKTMGTARLSCALENVGDKIPSMHWEIDGRQLKNDDKFDIHEENYTLIIKNPAHKDSGEYTCVFRFDDDGQTIKVPVNFYAMPIVKGFEKSKNLIQGDRLVLRCVVFSFPPATVSWFKDGKSLEGVESVQINMDENTMQANGKLEIAEVEFEDKGNYTCTASSTYFNSTTSGHIVVRVKDKLAALWPFLGIVAEVIVLCVIIFIYEKKRSRSEEAEDAADAGNCANAADHKAKEEVRQRNVRT